MTAVDPDECRKPGRPRSAEADEAIIAATLDLFADHGFDGLAVEAVACRAGVSKATIYRRYASKVELVLAAAAGYSQQHAPPPDTGNLRDDLRAIVLNLTRLVRDTVVGKIAARMAGEAIRNPALAVAHREFIAQRRTHTIAVIQRGIDRGELAANADPNLVADLVTAPVFYRALISGAPLDDALADDVADLAMRAFAP